MATKPAVLTAEGNKKTGLGDFASLVLEGCEDASSLLSLFVFCHFGVLQRSVRGHGVVSVTPQVHP